jgi:hypothetical protein
MEVFPGGYVVEVDWFGREVRSDVGWRQYRFKYAAGAKGCRVLVADRKGCRVGGCRRLLTSFVGKMLGQG